MNKKVLVLLWLTLLLVMVASVFWYNDWKYQLPTPVPENYKPVAVGTRMNVTAQLQHQQGKPLFLHFYNPDCPCSRFNKKHFQTLVHTYGDYIDFTVVVLSEKKYSVQAIQDKLDLKIPVIFDQSVADQFGVYATPQAALIDQHQKLYYRGNYNTGRYCTDEKTAFARIAIERLLKSQLFPIVSTQALTAYGCTIPVCKN